MKKSWTDGLDKEEAREIEQEYRGARRLRERLTEMLQKKSNVKQKMGRSEERYGEPAWPFHQADINGYTRAIEDIISLIE